MHTSETAQPSEAAQISEAAHISEAAYISEAALAPMPGSGGRRAAPRRFIDDVTIDYGPRELLARFFVEADLACRAQGIDLTIGTLDDLLEVNRANSDSWRPLVAVFDPRYGVGPGETFCILGRNAAGEVVATQAARLYRCPNSSFKSEIEALTLFYADPERQKMPGERAIVSAPSAERITGRVVFSGGVWYRPDYRKRGLSAIMPRISRALAFTRWATDYTMTMMAESVVRGGVAASVGYPNVEWDVMLINNPLNRTGELRMALLWMQAEYMLEDLTGFLGAGQRPEVDAMVHRRTA